VTKFWPIFEMNQFFAVFAQKFQPQGISVYKTQCFSHFRVSIICTSHNIQWIL